MEKKRKKTTTLSEQFQNRFIKSANYRQTRYPFGLKWASTPQVGTHCRHYLKSRSNFRVYSNQRPFQILRYMAELLVRVRVRADVIGRRFEKVRNGHRFEKYRV